jgi:hypothetical protein
MKKLLSGFAISFLAISSSFAIDDLLDTTGNFFNSFGGTTALANGNGTVTLTRNTPNIDAGIDWNNAGLNLSLATENIVTITPVAPVNGGFWSVNLLFFNGNTFVNEVNWIGDTQSTSIFSTDAAQLAGVGADNYFVRFRIQPSDQSDVGFTFTEISAIPEPAPVALVCAGVAALLLIVRCRI